MSPLVSILIPAYNAERWVGEALSSARAQTWKRKEIIVVDDGSTDATALVATSLADENVKVVTQKNSGAASARNTAFVHAQGDFIQWLDADDVLAPEKISRQMERAQTVSARTVLTGPWGHFYHRLDRARLHHSDLWQDLQPAEWLRLKLQDNLYMIIESWLVSRELTLAAGPWKSQLSVDDDGDYFCRVLKECDRIEFVPEAYSYYRNSSSQSLSKVASAVVKLDSQIASIRTHIATLLELRNDASTREACCAYLQRWLIYFYPERMDYAEQLMKMAVDLGGALLLPTPPGKYEMIRWLLGWKAAKKAMLLFPGWRSDLERKWDEMRAAFRPRLS